MRKTGPNSPRVGDGQIARPRPGHRPSGGGRWWCYGHRMVDIIDCSSVLHMTALVGADACAAARAAIRAAEIQAKSARHAGSQTLLAGLSTIIAGVLAYAAAGRTFRHEQRQARLEEYRFVYKLSLRLTLTSRAIRKLSPGLSERLLDEPFTALNEYIERNEKASDGLSSGMRASLALLSNELARFVAEGRIIRLGSYSELAELRINLDDVASNCRIYLKQHRQRRIFVSTSRLILQRAITSARLPILQARLLRSKPQGSKTDR